MVAKLLHKKKIIANFPVILLTGPPGIGKSTIIQQVVARLEAHAGGFYTQESRRAGERTGFEIVTIAGQRATLATRDPTPAFDREASLGRYRINLAAIDDLAVPTLQVALAQGQIIIVDEIGPMELFSPLFCEIVQQILDSNTPATGTIVQRSHPFANRVKAHPRVQTVQVTLDNRDELAAQLYAALVPFGVDESGGD
jgi:nucleoside-triphosphatase